MENLAPIIKDLAVILGIAGFVILLFQKIRQPVVLGYLLVGMIIGPYTPPHALVSDIPNIKVLAELGVIFLMFSLGLDFSFHKLADVGFSASVTGLIDVVLMVTFGFLAGQVIGWSFYNSLFLGAALSISSTTIIIKALTDLNLRKERFAHIIFGVLVVEDLLAVLMLVGLSTVALTHNIFSMEMVWTATRLILVVTSWFLIGYFFVPYLFRHIMPFSNSETLTIVSIALCLLLVTIALYFHYSAALGAFIMGSILSETPQANRIEDLIRPIRDMFAAVFFVSIGMLINPKVIIAEWPLILFLAAVTISGKIFACGIGAFISGQRLSKALRIGFGMAQIGEFSFIIIGLGTALGVIGDSLFAIVAAVSAVTIFTTSYLIRFSGYIDNKLQMYLPSKITQALENYALWVRAVLDRMARREKYRRAIVRFIINSIVVASIFAITDYIDARVGFRGWIKLSSYIGALVLISPFVWAMLFAFKSPARAKYFYVSPAMVVTWTLTFAEISFLSIAYLSSWTIGIILLVTAIVSFIFFSSYLEKAYHWFEQYLVATLKR